MNKRVLIVDDETNLLQSFRRSFHGRYELTTAVGGQAAFKELRESNPFAVIVSDMQMPEIDGLAVLTEAKKVSPNTVRIMLTGNVDQQTAVDAVNNGAIFRFLNKPCPLDKLGEAINEGLRQFELVTAEKMLLSQTLTGSIALLSEVLAMASPKAFGRGGRLRSLARRLADALSLPDAWQYEVAAMLSQIGFIGHSIEPTNGKKMDLQAIVELQRTQACQGGKLVARIPRLEHVATMIEKQFEMKFDGVPEVARTGACMLRILNDYDVLAENHSVSQAIASLQKDAHLYDGHLLEAFSAMVLGEMQIKNLPVHQLREHMILEDDVLTASGEMLIRRGHELTESLIQRLRTFYQTSLGVREPVAVRCSVTG